MILVVVILGLLEPILTRKPLRAIGNQRKSYGAIGNHMEP